MCGIAGIISKNNVDIKDEIVKMTDIISHRGPDGFGYYHGNNFSFGHRRLSIIDLTTKGAQPMTYKDRYVITYNGEIFNYIELKSELLMKGYEFYTDSDTEVIMAAYDFWGKDCLTHFNGMWAFALYDNQKNVIFCSRDRFGIKPFYYIQYEDKFAFSSEIKQFTVLYEWKPIVNKPRLHDFLSSNGIHDHLSETLFKNVYQLRGGEFLEYSLTNYTFTVSRWYDLGARVKSLSVDFEEAKQRFYELFSDAINLQLRSDVKVGSCLSGGLDSSSIVCMINQLLRQSGKEINQETISSCFVYKEVDEQEYIDEVIRKTGVKGHKIFPVFENLFSNIDKIIWHQDEPFGSTSVYAQWTVYEEARNLGMIVMLDGQGADEYLAGYSNFHLANFRELLLSFKISKLIKSVIHYKKCYKEYYINPYRELVKTVLQRLIPQSFLKGLTSLIKKTRKKSVNAIHWLKNENNDRKIDLMFQQKNNVREESEIQLLCTSLPKLLHHQDRDSMAHSVESRPPFLDYRLVEYVLALPSEYKIKNSVTKYILREALTGVTPNIILNRYDKLGFATPEEIWVKENVDIFRKEISEACDCLHSYVNKEKTLEWFDYTVKSGKKFNSIFWKLISVNHWVKVFNVDVE